MSRRRGGPAGVRAAGRAVRLLGGVGTIGLLCVCMLLTFAMCGTKFDEIANGETACSLPAIVGGPGVRVVGDSALRGLGAALPHRLNGGRVTSDIRSGRTAQQGENAIGRLADSAPSVFVVSLERDDRSSVSAFGDRVDELSVLLGDRVVYWVTVPGETARNAIVEKAAADPNGGGWKIVDFAGSGHAHPDWWAHGKPTRAGLNRLVDTLNLQIGTTRAGSTADTPPSGAGGRITVSSSTSAQRFVLDGERRRNAQTIVAVGESLHVPTRGLVIGVAAAIQESKLVNLRDGPAGAYGLFQETPAQGWGTVAQVENPTYAAAAFFKRLLRIRGWQDMALTDAAQAVQHSGYPDAYAQWERSASVIVAALQGQHAPGCGPQLATATNARAQIAVNAALAQLGVPYSFGGGNLDGPTTGQCILGTDAANDCHIVGFDCSGLMLYAWGKAGVTVPHFTVSIWIGTDFTRVSDVSQLQPGDIMMFEPSVLGGLDATPGHTGMWLGDNRLIDAPHSGDVVKIHQFSGWYRREYMGALRPKA